jgi:hypothetical protein
MTVHLVESVGEVLEHALEGPRKLHEIDLSSVR